jgi:hypothetical protein
VFGGRRHRAKANQPKAGLFVKQPDSFKFKVTIVFSALDVGEEDATLEKT